MSFGLNNAILFLIWFKALSIYIFTLKIENIRLPTILHKFIFKQDN